ncbi:PREDICTED: splicing factor, suppressor of white-apricot homolog isoform X2 [Priapulus caudatus]|uniref:Splicing factor, suppressor of white-apricot homolog isoform X2 n=1 Tax=Priapulus caudatus TaxID=37621 RepID=A0ABM1E8A9_PRICU|nr:PREDICTED: splicing factor, suppressor of white-apricot homolog isoform X2 [Priapulus caudatus]
MAKKTAGRWEKKELPESKRSDDLDDLLVFGYACKLFRDDERARYIDRGKHLIPWMGDESLMIDRYDGRGHVYDLNQYEADTASRHYQASEEEERIERLCDEERYMAMYKDLLEEKTYQEEEMKRLHEALQPDGVYHSIGFSYDNKNESDQYDPMQPTEEKEEQPEREEGEDEEPFIAPKELGLTPNIETPMTMKMNSIMEKTAAFVAQRGAQMEIVIKTKQANNSQFNFMHFDHYLHPYYDHMKRCIREGRYKPEERAARGTADASSSDDEDGEDVGYLHPSLFAKKQATRVKNLHLEQLRKLQAAGKLDSPYAQLVTRMKQTQEEYKIDAPLDSNNPSSPDSTSGLDQQGAPSPPEAAPASATQLSATSSLAYPAETDSHPAPPGVDSAETMPPYLPDVNPVPEVNSCSAPDQHSTSSQSQHTSVPPPPPDKQPIIIKMAEYAVRNGPRFEEGFLAKKDERFEFLKPGHQHYAYYVQTKGLFEAQFAQQASVEQNGGPTSISSGKGKPVAISFSIKPKDVDAKRAALDKPPALLGEESEESATEEETLGLVEEPAKPPSKSPSMTALCVEDTNSPPMLLVVCPVASVSAPDITDADSQSKVLEKAKKSLDELEAKQAEERLRDRLAIAARERLAQASKEKQLQIERKKKAAMFLSLLKGEPGKPGEAESDSKLDSLPPSSVEASPMATPERVVEEVEIEEERPRPLLPQPAGLAAIRARSPSRSGSRSSRARNKKSLPSAYSAVRRSLTPPVPKKHERKRSRSRSKGRHKRRSRSRERKRLHRAKSPERKKKSRRSKSRTPERSNKLRKKKKRSRSRSSSLTRLVNKKKSKKKPSPSNSSLKHKPIASGSSSV